MNKDPAKPSHMVNQVRVLRTLSKPPGLTLLEAHKCLIEKGYMQPNSVVPSSWDEVSANIPAHQEHNSIQEATFA